jgi:Na+-transporting NADH:ubiquinone oxidoreductase subunit NqrA
VFTRRVPLVTVAEEHRPDLLITAVGDGGVSEIDRVLDRCPKVVILAVEADGRRSFLYRLKPDKEKLGELSPETLLKAARRVVPASS